MKRYHNHAIKSAKIRWELMPDLTVPRMVRRLLGDPSLGDPKWGLHWMVYS